MAKAYFLPELVFFMDQRPRHASLGVDFRGPRRRGSPREEAVVRALVRKILAGQRLLRAEIVADQCFEEVAFVGSLMIEHGSDAALAHLDQLIGSARPQSARNPAQAFDALRRALHAAGVFVLLKGDLGSHHTAVSADLFRGFALADRFAPYIVINPNDARAAWSFTLVHELVHILLGNTGMSSGPTARPDHRAEEVCNDVASTFLLPEAALPPMQPTDSAIEETVSAVEETARENNVSRTLVAYRLLRAGTINGATYRALARRFRTEWRKLRERARGTGQQGTGPSWYAVRRHRTGKALLDVVRHFHHDNSLVTTKAATVLGVRPAQVHRLLNL